MKLRIKFLWRSWNFIYLSVRTKKSFSRWVSSLGERSPRVREVPGSNPNMSVFILYIRGDWPSILDTPRLIAQRTYVFLFSTLEVTENRSQIPLVWWHKCYHCATQTLSADFSCVIILSLLTCVLRIIAWPYQRPEFKSDAHRAPRAGQAWIFGSVTRPCPFAVMISLPSPSLHITSHDFYIYRGWDWLLKLIPIILFLCIACGWQYPL